MAPLPLASIGASIERLPRALSSLSHLASHAILDVPPMVGSLLPFRSTSTTSPDPLRPSPVSALVKRQTIVAIPATYAGINPGANGGEIAGIVIGAVCGTILVLWLISVATNPKAAIVDRSSVTDAGTARKAPKSRRRERSIAETRSEVTEAQSRSPQRRQRSPRRPRETIVIEETRRDLQRERPRSVSLVRDRDEDIVEVIEEHSPPPRRESRRYSNGGGYRAVDPDAFAGGGRAARKARR